MLRFVIRATTCLLALGTVLVIMGIFDAFLRWDIFGDRVEAFLYGVFFSSLALAAVGIAVSFVLGLQELIDVLRAGNEGRTLAVPRPMKAYLVYCGLAVAALVVLVASLDAVDDRVQDHRRGVFKRIAQEQMAHLGPKISAALPEGGVSPAVPPTLDQLLLTLNNLDFVHDATLYLPDAGDPDALWQYRRGWNEKNPSRFERIFATRSREQAAREALDGEPAGVEAFNAQDLFQWLEMVPVTQKTRAVVRIQASPEQNFRDYEK